MHLVDSTPIECASCRPTVQRSDLADWAGYGYCGSHSRFLWGLRMIATPACPSGGMGPHQPQPGRARGTARHARAPGAHRRARSWRTRATAPRDLEDDLNQAGLTLLHPAARNEAPRPDADLLRPLRQRIESVFDTLKDQLGIERHSGPTPTGVTARVAQHIPALTAVIWHNDNTANPHLRSLTPYDH